MRFSSWNRREFLVRSAGAAVALGVARRGFAADAPVVSTTKGKLKGIAGAGFVAFKGVPYAGGAEGANRFKPPTPVQAWTGVRDAVEYGLPAIQDQEPMPVPGSYTDNGPTTENCQVLNVWTPALDGKKRPVMYYCHGGGFLHGSGGSGTNPGYDGSALAAKHDVVVVTHNHRLGIMGYLYLEDVLGAEYAGSGIAGMLDIVQGLEWVRDNIAAFGGDPGNVTIQGQSGGGFKVSTLLAMPKAHGLFHKAIIESGAGLRTMPKQAAIATTEALLKDLGLTKADAKKLLDVPTAKLLDFQMKYLSSPKEAVGTFAPVVDGKILPSHPFDPIAPAISAGIPVLVGCNKDESLLGLSHRSRPEVEKIFNLDEAGLLTRVKDALGPNADMEDRVLEVLRKNRPTASPTDLYIAITTGMGNWIGAINLAERKAKQHAAPVYMYRFSYESDKPASPFVTYPMKTPHGLEIWFKFDHAESSTDTGTRPERFELAHTMAETWATFARTGNPNNKKIPVWPTYNAETRATMIIDAKWKVENDPNKLERELWQQL